MSHKAATELQYDTNDPSVTADRGDILMAHKPLSS